jgi:ribosomal protein S18 acetylase RimI-like enzyme
MGNFRIEVLSADHDRDSFDCGSPALNEYLSKRAGQDARRRIATCFAAIEKTSGQLAGYYTLSACGVALEDLPPDLKKKLPRYPTVPAILIGRLAVDRRFQGQRLGEALLANALCRMLNAEIAAAIAVVDAKDEPAAKFYQRFGFLELSTTPRRLFIPLSEKLRALAGNG